MVLLEKFAQALVGQPDVAGDVVHRQGGIFQQGSNRGVVELESGGGRAVQRRGRQFFAGAAGLEQSHIDATAETGVSPAWSGRDAALIRLADELHDDAGVSEAAWAALAAHSSDEQILEMIALCGYYHTISFMANATRLAPESFAARFKPGVRAAS